MIYIRDTMQWIYEYLLSGRSECTWIVSDTANGKGDSWCIKRWFVGLHILYSYISTFKDVNLG